MEYFVFCLLQFVKKATFLETLYGSDQGDVFFEHKFDYYDGLLNISSSPILHQKIGEIAFFANKKYQYCLFTIFTIASQFFELTT